MPLNPVFARTAHFADPEEINHRGLNELYAAWKTAIDVQSSRVLEQKFQTDQLAGVIQHMALLTLHHDPLVAHYEIVGSALIRLLGSDPTGKAIDEVYPRSISKEIYKTLATVSEEGTPRYTVREFRVLMHHFGYRRLILPLYSSAEAMRPTRAIVGIYPVDRKLTDAFQWKRGVHKAQKVAQTLNAETQSTWVRSLGRERFTPIDDAKAPSKNDLWLVE